MGVPTLPFRTNNPMPRTRKPETTRARSLRRRMTEAERRLWWHLDRIPVPGTHFRRQAPIGPYIVDFTCHRPKVVIEVDGAQHGFDQHAQNDVVRTEWLESQGYRVLRFWNREILFQIDVVLDTIYAALYTAIPTGLGAGTPTPGPSPQGGGE